MRWGPSTSRSALVVPSSQQRRTFRSTLAALLLIGAGVSASAQGTTGSITGIISDGVGSIPLAAATVRIPNTQIGAQSAADGRFTIRGVTPGDVKVQVTRIGYEAKIVSVVVKAGATATLNVSLTAAAFSLQTVVTTVTGVTAKAEMSNTIATVDVGGKIAETPITTTGELLSGRASGVQVLSGGATGAGSRIRIRGQSSLSLGNDPIVYIDGVRADASTNDIATGTATGGSTPSALDNISPEEIETIDIIKGPAAATLYGTQAANGVILITTKRGHAGSTRWNAFSENGTLYDPHKGSYPDLWVSFTHANGKLATCTLVQEANGACTIDSTYHGDVMNSPTLSPLNNGNRAEYGLQASGGTDKLQYFVSGDAEHEQGPYKMPQGEISRLTAERGTSVGDDQIYPNALKRVNFRTNLNAQLTPKADLSVSVGYIDQDIRQPQNEDNGNGLMVDVLGGSARTDLLDSRGVPLLGYRSFPIGDVFAQVTTQNVNRYISSLSGHYFPLSWLSLRSNVGYDYTARNDQFLNQLNQGLVGGLARTGQITDARTESDIYTADMGGTATFALPHKFNTKTSVGVQYFHNYRQTTQGNGVGLTPGATELSGSTTETTTQTTTETVNMGAYGEEVLSYSERFFLTGGLRYDGNSAFGSSFSGVYYPKIGASWLVSDESWFPKFNALNSFRIRSTYGASGVQPGALAAIRYYSPTTGNINGVEQAAVTLGALGNPSLKPEYSGEFEGGMDLTGFQNHTTLELSYYNKKTKDALIAAPLAPSVSGVVATQLENLGSTRNQGVELTVNQKIIDNSQVGAEIQLTASANKNRILTLGQGITPIFTGNRSTQKNAPGYPLFGLWSQTYTYSDPNGDGKLTNADVKISDTAVFIGPTYPTHEFALSPRLELLHRKLSITAQFDHKDGMTKFFNTLRHRCQGGASCEGDWDPNATLAQQAAAIADNNYSVYSGMMYNGEFTRLREMAVTYELPDRWASKVHASRLALVGTGRNLHTWTKYPGLDPEAGVGNQDDRANEEYFSTPPLRYFTLRLNLGF